MGVQFVAKKVFYLALNIYFKTVVNGSVINHIKELFR
jgi:hypothetical protein